MTRFARAKGCKASNERVPERATSWTEMKQSLLEQKKETEYNKEREQFNKQRTENYKTFLAEKEQEELQNTEWASFPKQVVMQKANTQKKRKTGIPTVDFNEIKAKLDKVLPAKSKQNHDDDSDDEPPNEESSKIEPTNEVIKVKKPKSKLLKVVMFQEAKTKVNNDQKITNVGNMDKSISKKRKHESMVETKEVKKIKKIPNVKTKGNSESTKSAPLTDEEKELRKKEKLKRKYQKILEKRKQRKLEARLQKEEMNGETSTNKLIKKPIDNKSIVTEEDQKKISKKKDKKLRQLETKKMFKEVAKQEGEKENGQYNSNDDPKLKSTNNEISNFENNKRSSTNTFENTSRKHVNANNERQVNNNMKNNNDKSKNRKEQTKFDPNKMRPHTMQINGKTIEVDYVDGFPVKKEDAERLKKLRKEMISKGLPRSEINISLKLERRRAEKAFAREKKNVCFNCRTSGHNLSECPELGKNQFVESAGTGICFKCGSTEHTHFECRVVKGMDYKFAQCFICKEQGHIAKQCPDNARGLYPKGGACKICGDVTHLKKDCPKFHAQQQQLNNFHVETMDGRNPDDLSKPDFNSSFKETQRANKIIKF